jgi:hypothetical protein
MRTETIRNTSKPERIHVVTRIFSLAYLAIVETAELVVLATVETMT